MKVPTSNHTHLFPEILGYSIVEQLYLGSRTAVYRAVQTATQRPVVIKMLRREYPSFGELVQFRNQYAIAKNLSNPGIVQPLSLEPVGSGYALVMEDFCGVALGTYIQQQPLNLTDVLAIAMQIADILHDLAQYRVVHKDIKPANILIHPDSKQVKLIDFSIASLLPKETQEIQSPNILEGTLTYLAPEQTGRMNRGIDYRADFYALGVTLYQLLTGSLPFQSEDPLELVHCHIAKMPTPIAQVNPDVPTMVSAIVAKLMAKNAEERYQSAMGLKHDLERCLTQWKELGAIADFKLGERDLSDRFLIPEKLYGRETEVKSLLAAFDRVADGASELMLVAGFSGIGKTAVVNEVHKPIVRQRGYFIKGKFDQFNRNIPLSAFVQVLRDLMAQLLSESDTQLAKWQTQILSAVGDNGQVLIEVIPELEQVIGKQSAVPELSGSAAQNRFNLLFQKFIQVFTTKEHPLVMFLDDLQWADLASLQLLKLLMDDNSYLLILGAYRDNEVSPVHPFILTVAEIQKAQVVVNTITLAPLAFADTNHLVADTLNCSLELAQPLTELIERKTKGNPFFTTQFLKALHDDGHIIFVGDSHSQGEYRNRRYWECKIVQVNTLSLTDDVVEFMALQLQKLPVETQQVLKLAACVGNQFDLATLAIVCEQSSTDTATALWKALQEGLILPTNQVYKFFQDVESSEAQNTANPTYRFLHDRVQQAADFLIPEDQKQATHLKIGQLLLQNLTAQEREEKLFDIVNHFNSGKALLVNPGEREDCARLNLSAGQKAKISTAYSAAFAYLTSGIELLSSTCWQTQYDLTLSLQTEAAEVAYLNGRFEELDAIAQTVLTSAKTLLDKTKIYETQIQAYVAQNKLDLAIQTGQTTLKSLGIHIPQQGNMAKVLLGLVNTKRVLAGKKIPDLVNLPTMQDSQDLAAMKILTSILSATLIAAPKLLPLVIFKQIDLSVNRGNTALSAFTYGGYGIILCGVLLDIDTGYQFGQLAIQVQEKLNAKEMRCKVLVTMNTFIKHWKDPLQSTIAPLQEAYQAGLETGDIEYVTRTATVRAMHLYCIGHSLPELEPDLKGYAESLSQFKQDSGLLHINTYRQAVENLLGKSANPSHLTGDCYSEETDLPTQIESGDRTGIAFSYITQLELCYRFGDFPKALAKADLAKQYEEACAGFAVIAPLYFYDSLTQLAVYPDANKSEQKRLLKRVAANQKKMKIWAKFAPTNHQHKYDLVEAERQYILGNKSEAMELYDRAIANAKANHFVNEESLAQELAAKFYLDWGKEKIAASYMHDAYYGYARWGAKAKIQDLERHYPNLLAPILQQQRTSLSATETVFAPDSQTTFQPPNTHSSTNGSTSISATIDLAAVLKASQSLSSEIQLDKLLAVLLHTVLENAGADKGALLMPHENEWFVEAIATVDRPTRVESIVLSDSQEISHSLINSVKRSLQPVVIVDVATHPTLAKDAYVVQNQPKSMLCTPILQQGKLVAILYLENNVTLGAFTSDRIELLNFLCAQAAISLENARLYKQSQTYAQQIEQSQLQTVQSEKMASLGNLVAGVAHEINNPIGFLNGSIKNAKDYVQDLLDYIALYQQHHPNAALPVQEKAEDIDLEFLGEDLPKLLDSMQGATDRIKGISTSLRTFSRADTDRKVSANLHDGIDSTLLILKYRLKANEFRPAIAVIQDYGDIPAIDCFPGQLNQVFMNVLANAIDMFDEVAQTQSLEKLKANPQKITICTTVEANHVLIQICDNGKGMTKEVQAKIFDHLFTTKGVGKGTGLGLAITRQIVVEKHGGSLEVHSKLGEGSEFCICLPIAG